MEFRHGLEMRWSDVDANGHVRHSVYPDLGAEARLAWLREGGFDWKRFLAEGVGPVLLREEIDYRRELELGERVEVDVSALGLSPEGGRWRLRHVIRKADGEVAGEIVVVGGWIDLRQRRLVAAPPALLDLLRAAPRAADYADLPPLRRDAAG